MPTTVLSVWQPWASLLATGTKTIETRTEPAPAALVGQRIAIHASSTRARDHVFKWLERQYPDAFAAVVARAHDASPPTMTVRSLRIPAAVRDFTVPTGEPISWAISEQVSP